MLKPQNTDPLFWPPDSSLGIRSRYWLAASEPLPINNCNCHTSFLPSTSLSFPGMTAMFCATVIVGNDAIACKRSRSNANHVPCMMSGLPANLMTPAISNNQPIDHFQRNIPAAGDMTRTNSSFDRPVTQIINNRLVIISCFHDVFPD